MEVINLWAGPSCGKSETAFGLTYFLKKMGYSVEMVPEYAKEITYDGTLHLFNDQLSVLAEQHRRLDRLTKHVAFAVVDSPLPLPTLYTPPGYVDEFEGFTWSLFHRYKNRNFFLERDMSIPYEEVGRRQKLDEALIEDNRILHMMRTGCDGWNLLSTEDGDIVDQILVHITGKRRP